MNLALPGFIENCFVVDFSRLTTWRGQRVAQLQPACPDQHFSLAGVRFVANSHMIKTNNSIEDSHFAVASRLLSKAPLDLELERLLEGFFIPVQLVSTAECSEVVPVDDYCDIPGWVEKSSMAMLSPS